MCSFKSMSGNMCNFLKVIFEASSLFVKIIDNTPNTPITCAPEKKYFRTI